MQYHLLEHIKQLFVTVFLREDHNDPYLVSNQCRCTLHSNIATTNDNNIFTGARFHHTHQLIRIMDVAQITYAWSIWNYIPNSCSFKTHVM